jgi:hypothetical protein
MKLAMLSLLVPILMFASPVRAADAGAEIELPPIVIEMPSATVEQALARDIDEPLVLMLI